MARSLRIQYPGALYHVMNRGTSRLPTFFSEDNKRLFLHVLSDAVAVWDLRIHAFCLMNNHYHLLLETPLGNLSRAMRHIDGVYTQRINKITGRDGALFRGRFKSILVQKETYFLVLLRYIHMNGVKAGIYTHASDDPFCSHQLYMNPSVRPKWLTVGDALSRFGGDSERARQYLNAFVHAPVGQTLHQRLDEGQWPAAIGGKQFLANISATFLTEPHPHPEMPQDKELRRIVSPDRILAEVEEAYGLPTGRHWVRAGQRQNQPRLAAMHLLRKVCLLSYSGIGDLMGGVGYGTVAEFLRKPVPTSECYRMLEDRFLRWHGGLKTQT